MKNLIPADMSAQFLIFSLIRNILIAKYKHAKSIPVLDFFKKSPIDTS